MRDSTNEVLIETLQQFISFWPSITKGGTKFPQTLRIRFAQNLCKQSPIGVEV
jgi:hypothetical protein